MAVPLAELKSELTLDPRTYGYNNWILLGQMQTLAGVVNQERSELPQVFRTSVLRAHILAYTDENEYYALTAAQRQLYNSYTQTNLNMEQSPEMRAQIEGLFAPDSSTVSALQTYVWKEKSSRAEELWGQGTIVSWQECVAALALP